MTTETRAEYRFDLNHPVTREIIARGRAFKEKPQEPQNRSNSEGKSHGSKGHRDGRFSTTVGRGVKSLLGATLDKRFDSILCNEAALTIPKGKPVVSLNKLSQNHR